MSEPYISGRVQRVLVSLPRGVILVAAAKMRTAEEAHEAVLAGVTVIGHNYVQEAEAMRRVFHERWPDDQTRVKWHLIGHLQSNKAGKAAHCFDMIETMDSLRIAELVERQCAEIGKIMPVLIEVNTGREAGKTGVAPETCESLVRQIAGMPHLRVQGLMTMGYAGGDMTALAGCFKTANELFNHLAAAGFPNVEMRYLSMGMSDSYRLAIEHGANMVRIGTLIFGERHTQERG
jgi:PLP dependent protein